VKSQLKDFLPKHLDTKLASARISKTLHEAVRTQMSKDQEAGIPIDWIVLIEAACKTYLAERGVKNVG
jgi:hypothetical protein